MRKILDIYPQKLHLISLLHTFLLLLLGLTLLVSDLIFLVELLDELGDLILFFGSGQVAADFSVVHAVEEREESGRVEVLTLDVELSRVIGTDWTSCCVISD